MQDHSHTFSFLYSVSFKRVSQSMVDSREQYFYYFSFAKTILAVRRFMIIAFCKPSIEITTGFITNQNKTSISGCQKPFTSSKSILLQISYLSLTIWHFSYIVLKLVGQSLKFWKLRIAVKVLSFPRKQLKYRGKSHLCYYIFKHYNKQINL